MIYFAGPLFPAANAVVPIALLLVAVNKGLGRRGE
jgi:hypothetical protein